MSFEKPFSAYPEGCGRWLRIRKKDPNRAKTRSVVMDALIERSWLDEKAICGHHAPL